MKKKKHHSILYYLTISIVFLLFIGIGSSMIAFQTSFGKNKIKSLAISYLKKQNIDLSFDSISGALPFGCELTNVELQIKDEKIEIENLKFRIAFWPLINKNLVFRSFKASNAKIYSSEMKTLSPTLSDPPKPIKWLSTPINISFRSIKITDLTLPNNLVISAKGNGKLKKNGNYNFDIALERKEFKNSSFVISFDAKKIDRSIKANLKLVSDTTKSLLPFVDTKLDFSFYLDIILKGSFDTFFSFITDKKEKDYLPLDGSIKGHISHINSKLSKNLEFLLNRQDDLSVKFITNKDLSIDAYDIHFRNILFTILGTCNIDKNLSLNKYHFSFNIKELSKINPILPIPVYGKFTSNAIFENRALDVDYKIDHFLIDDYPITDFKGTVHSKMEDIKTGNFKLSCFALNQPLNISSDFKLDKKLDLTNISLTAPSSTSEANLTITPNYNISGEGKIQFDDLSQIQAFIPKINFNASGDINFEFTPEVMDEKTQQNVTLDLNASDFHIKDLFGSSLKLNLKIEDLFSSPKYFMTTEAKETRLHDLKFDSFSLQTSTDQENWPFAIHAKGFFKEPLEMQTSGFWKYFKNQYSFNIQEITGDLFSHPFVSINPIKLEFSKEEFLLSNLNIELSDSKMLSNIHLTKDKSTAQITLKHFPIDFLSINPLDLNIGGYASLNLDLKSHQTVNGKIDLDLEELTITAIADQKPIRAHGKLNATIDQDYLNLTSSLFVKDSHLLSSNANIPINISLIPFKIDFDQSKNIKADFSYKGKVEEILDFINIGPQRLEGNLVSTINLRNSLSNPDISGFIDFKDGLYENYYTGTYLEDISANLIAEDQNLILKTFKATDHQEGTLLANGTFSINPKKHHPFAFHAELDNLTAVETDIFKITALANIDITGDKISSVAKGFVKLNNSSMSIPDKLPVKIPDLKINYINHPTKKDIAVTKLTPSIYPINLDFKIDASNPIIVNGQGLNSTWHGNFDIGGTYENIEAKGTLELIEGIYSFSGRRFDLTKGLLTFTGKPHEMPYLDLKAKINQQGIDIIANLEGPLDTPKLYFRSEPPLPASSILSLLLFGQELSGISAAQLVTVAQSMNEQKKTSSSDSSSNLGIDRFNIVSTSTQDPDASDQMALQLGKYITRGVVVSFSQGTEQGSSNVIVEIDLRGGFVFQAETQQEQEQGKFSLKWRHDY